MAGDQNRDYVPRTAIKSTLESPRTNRNTPSLASYFKKKRVTEDFND